MLINRLQTLVYQNPIFQNKSLNLFYLTPNPQL